MDIAECINKIDRFLSKENVQPLIVDVQNQHDLSELVVHYNVGNNKVIKASDYSKSDELPQIDTLFHDLETLQGTLFVTGISSFLKLHGEDELRKVIKELLSLTTVGHVVVLTYQCHKYMEFKDPRLYTRVAVVEGVEQSAPEIFLSSPGLSLNGVQIINGIDSFASSIENKHVEKLLIYSSKEKADFPKALFHIDTKLLKRKLKAPASRPLADFLPTISIKAKDLAAEMTSVNVQTKDLYGQEPIEKEHVDNNSAVRDMLVSRGIYPEQLPPAEDIKKVERRVAKEEKEILKDKTKLPKNPEK